MANGGVLDTSGIMGVIENALNKLNNVAEGASKIEAEIDGANRGTKEWNRTLEETKRHVNEIDSAMDDLNDGGAIETQIKSQKQLQRELNETAKRFLDTQEKLGRFKGFSSDDKLSREITKQFNLIKKGETEFYEARSRINKVVNELATASRDTIGAEHFDKITNAITQATDKLSVFLQEIRDAAKEINSKNFGFSFNLTDSQGESERLEQYKNMWRSYGQAVGDALNEVARLSNDREFKTAAGPDFQRQIAQVGMLAYEYDAMEKSFKKSMQSVKTFAGADTAGKQLQEYAARIQPIIEKAKELGRSDFDINRFLKPEIPAGALNQAEKLQTILSGITGQAQEVGAVAANANGGATAQALNNESGAVQKLNEMYELHRAAVAAATAAEVEKTNVSKQLLEALTKEGEALRLNEESNWFSNIEKTVSSIDTAVRSINEFYQSFQQLNSAGDSINQNINEPLKQAGEKLREVDITFLESQLRMVGARMEALRVPSDQMTSSLTAMEDALRNYKDENLPIKDRNAALAAFNENNKTANQLIREQNYLNQQAAKELNELTRAQDELDKSSAKRLTAEQKTAFDDAKRAIEEYYKAQQMLLKDQKAYSDIRLTDNGYQSQSGNYGALAAELNRTKIAYDLVTDAQNKNQLSADGILKLNQQLADKQRQYELQLEQANNKEREAAEKAAESARKKQEQAEATERAAKAKQIEAMATQQLKDTERQNSANAKEVANDYSRMLDLLRKIGKESANKQNFLASGDLIKAADADKWLKKYIADYRTLKLEIGSKLNTKQLEEITHELQNQKRAIDARNAAAQQAAQGDAVKADQTSLKNATTSYNEIINSFELLKGKSVEAQTAIDNLKAAMEAVRATSPGTEERAKAMEALAQASTTATAAVDAAAEADRRKAEADALAAKAENEHAEAERKSTKEAQEKERTESKRINMLVQVQKELVRAEAAEKKFSAAQHTTGLKDTYNDLKNTTSQLRDLEQQLRSGVPPTTEMRNQFAQLRSELTRTTADLQLNGNALGRWFTSGVSQLKSRMATTLGLSAMVYKAVGEIKKMVSTAVELDSAMNTLQIVTRSSGEELAAYGTRVSAMAKETAQATKDLIDATTVYARLGYSMDDSAVLSKYTAMLQGVGDIEAGAAQDAMTAILKAFNVNIDEVESVMDKLVVVGNNFPISVSQLAEGMNNAGSMLAVAGNTFEESIALLTASNATVQNISKASTGLRTIAARIRKMKTEDGEIVEESKYNAMIDALTRHNVALVDANGEYRKTYDIIKDIAGVWGQMTSMQKSAVVEALAGTRQQNIFASLMTQFDDAEKAMKRMETAAGELQDSYDIYLNSIKAHTQQLKAAFDELSVKVVNSDFVKGVVDFVRKLVEGLSKLVDSVGTLGIALSALGSLAIIKFISGGGWVGFVLSLTKVVLAIVSAAPHLLALAGLFGSLILLVKAWQQAHPSMDTLIKEADEAQKKVDDLNKTLENNRQRLEELNKLKADGSITEAQEKELAILKQQTEELKAQLHVTQALADTAHANVINKVHGDVNTFFNAPTQGRYLGEGAGEGAIYEQADPAAEKLRRDLERYQELQKDLDHVNTKIGFANREYEDAVAFAEEMQAEVAQKNVDLSRTVFGNIDTENRLRLEWTKDTVKQYKDILQGYLRDGEEVEDWIGSYSTVLGQWGNFDVDGKSIPIAFSPILQTMNGPVLLDDDTVSNYINDVIHEAERRGDTSAESLLKIDASGLFEHDGMMLWGLIADIGDEAERVSEIMHFVGTDGAMVDATQSQSQALQNINSLLEQQTNLKAEIEKLSGSTAEQEQQLLEWREQLLNEDDSESIELLSQLEDMLDDIQKVTKKDTYEIEKFKRNLDYLDSTVRNKLAKGLDLAGDEIKEFDNWMSRCGYDMDSFNKMLAQLGSNAGDIGFEGDEENKSALEMHISQWGTLTEEIQKATAAMEEYEDKMKGLKGGTLAERLQEGWADTMDEIAQGRANSDAAWAFYELLFSDEQIDAAGRNVERLAQMVASYKAIFDDDNTENGFKDDDSPYGLGQRLIHFLEDNAASYQNIRFDRDANGLTYIIADFKALAEEMGWADEAFTMLIQDAQAYSDTLIIDTTQYNKLVDGLNAFTEGIDPSNINEAKDALQKFMEVAIQEEDYVGDRDFLRMLDMLNGDGYIQLDPSYYREILEQAKTAIEEAKSMAAEEAASEESNPIINMDIDEEQVLNDTENLLNNIQAYLNDNPRYITYLPNEYDYETGDSGGGSESGGGTSFDKPSSAIGKRPGKNGGDTLVNELGPELISDNGRAFIANGGKPGFVKLSDNAIVFTANETKDILKGKRNVNARAYASGNVGRGNLIGRLIRGSVNARGYISCPVCGWANPDSRSTCSHCGASLRGGSAATVNNSIGTTGNANAGVNRSAYGSPTAMPYENMGGTGYDIYGYDDYDQQAYEAYVQAQYYMEEQRLLLEAAKRREEEARRKAAIAEHKNKLNETKRNTGTNKNTFSGTGGGNHIGGSDYQSFADPQKVDWIAVRINRLQRAIADLEKVASSGFKALDKRLSAARDQIQKTTEEISVMDRAYHRYLAEADKVGLSSDIEHKIREGSIDINSYDDDTRKKIDEYTEW